MKKQYVWMKVFTFTILSLMIVLFGIILNIIYKNMTSEASSNSSFPSLLYLLYLLIYIPILILGIWLLKQIKIKIRILYPDKLVQSGPLTKKLFLNKSIKALIYSIAVCSLILLISPFAIIYFITSHHVYYRNNSLLQMTYTASDFGLTENILSLKTDDNLNIWASEISAVDPEAIIILLTGIEQPSITQFYPQAKLYQENGYSSILLEVRGHGKSDGNKVCLGYDEILDVKATLDYIKNKEEYKNKPIILHGVSMGGAIAINAFGLYSEIDGLIAMSSYATFEDVLIDNLKYYNIPDFICRIEKPLIKLALKASFGTEKVNKINPITQIKNTGNRPTLLVAASGDTSVPPHNTKAIYEKASLNTDLWILDSWEHFIVKDCVLTKVAEDEEYCNRIFTFIEKVLK